MKKVKILVVVNKVEVLNSIKSVLLNYDTIIESSSLKAAELIQQERFDIYIVDYQIPGLNGIELLKLIQNEYKDKDYVSIFCTACGYYIPIWQ